MSGVVWFGLAMVAAIWVASAVGALLWRRQDDRLDRLRAARWAKNAGLPLPDDLVPLVARRVRRQALAGAPLTALLTAPAAGLAVYLSGMSLLHPEKVDISPFLPGPALLPLFAGPAVLAAALTQLWDVAREQRREGERVERPGHVGLRTAVPAVLLWAARLLALGAPVVAVVTLWAIQRHGYAPWLHWYVFAVPLLLAALGLRSVENRQSALLNARPPEGSWEASAIDDAFRTQAVLALVPLVPTAVYLGGTLLLHSAFAAAGHGTGRISGAAGYDLGWTPIGIACFLLLVAVGQPKVQRYYRRRGTPQPSQPSAPESAPC